MKEVAKKIYLRTFGCQMNEYDSEIIKSILSDAGYSFAENLIDADVILLNTCAVRENAKRKVYGHIHEIRHKRGGKPAIYGILGCIATYLQDEILEDKGIKIDLIVGPDSYKRLPEILETVLKTHQKKSDVDLSGLEGYTDISPQRESGINAWIAIMRGCDNFCTFCVVPYTRGRERSRSVQSILDETKKAILEKKKQVTLLGQNVNSYKHKNSDFSDLFEKVSKVKGLERVRFTSPHPKDFPEKLLDVMTKNKKICNHIHFPLQSGNNRILKLMNRTYTQKKFMDTIKKMRKKIPDIVITTDIIIGFPTETDEEFEETFNIMKEVEFDSAFIFKYSPRAGTVAAKKFKDDVTKEKKKRRIIRLNQLQKEISLKKNKAHIGQIHEVLIEQNGTSKSDNKLQSRNEGNKIVILPEGPYSVGQMISAKITDATPHVLRGAPV